MRILFSTPGYKPAWRIGGPAVSVAALAESLVERGHDVTVFTTNSNLDQDLDVPTDRAVEVDGVRVHYFRHEEPLKRLLPNNKYLTQSIGLLYAPQMADALRAAVPHMDLVHTHLPFVYPTLAAARAAFRAHAPLFYHQRGVLDAGHLKFRALKKAVYLSLVEKPILRRATTLIGLTEAERASYAALGVTTPCRVVPNGIRLPSARTDQTDALAAREFGIQPHHRVILFMGRLHPIKGADRLLHAFERIGPSHSDALLVMAGPDEFGIEQGFTERVRAAGLASRVRFPGMVIGEAKSALLHRADVFCLPSDGEGFSMAILEALAHETAVVISTRCFFPAVSDAGAGRVVEPTVAALESALRDLLSQPERLRAMGVAGHALVASRYTWASVTSAMTDAYTEGIDRFKHVRRRA